MSEEAHRHEHHGDPTGSAVLDIGGDVGALLLRTGPERHEQEIHVAPVQDPDHRTHTVVRAHPLPGGGHVHAALFPALAAGDYRVVGGDGRTITIRGGEVTDHT